MVSDRNMLPIYGSNLGWAVGCSSTGASHIRGQKPCQDAYALWSSSSAASPCLIAAVADGHGESQYDHSQFGASIAVCAAVHELVTPLPDLALFDDITAINNAFFHSFPLRMTERWRNEIHDDVIRRFGVQPPDLTQEEATIRRYGTTLLVARISSRLMMFAKIGDGDIVLLRPDGRIEFPLPIEPLFVGTATYSLASREAATLWQTAVLPRGDGGLLILATDGLSDSFGGSENSEFHVFLRSLRDRLTEYGIEKVAASLPHWLSSYSDQGSGDDITLVMMTINPELSTAPEMTSIQSESTNNTNREGELNATGNWPEN